VVLMTSANSPDTRSSLNPIFNDNKIKLGLFHINGPGGARTLVRENFALSWDNSLNAALAADAAGFEAIVPYSRWTSEATPGHQSGTTFETLTWAAGIGSRTRHSCVMSTCHVMHIHPLVAAKAASTIDHICGGRFALNIVCGWMPADMKMFGHADTGVAGRYAYADEWTTILKRLWTETDEFDFSGNYLQVARGYSSPHPLQQPYPALMNAGGSDEGQSFVGKHCDIAFIRTETHELMQQRVARYRRFVAETYGREVQIWIQAYVVQRESYAEAMKYVDYYAVEHADRAHIDAIMAIRNRPLSPEQNAVYRRNLGAGPGGLPLLGHAQDIADELIALSSLGIDGVLMTWVDVLDGVQRFGREVIPLLEQAGYRRRLRQRRLPAAKRQRAAADWIQAFRTLTAPWRRRAVHRARRVTICPHAGALQARNF
jgi:alkanesulfonate monooxygenase SsuD/methylene tetrahydromethanopterin reductase-like flavin-dependent oxidoreductase (luciferase family)